MRAGFIVRAAVDRWAALRHPEKLSARGVRPGGLAPQAMQGLLARWKAPISVFLCALILLPALAAVPDKSLHITLTPSGKIDTRFPDGNDAAAQIPLNWGTVPDFLNQPEGTPLTQDVRSYLVDDPGATITVIGSPPSGWACCTSDDLTYSGTGQGLAQLRLRATYMGTTADSNFFTVQSVSGAGSDTTAPNPPSISATVVSDSRIDITVLPNSDPCVAGQTASGLKEIRIYRNGTLIRTQAVNPGLSLCLQRSDIGTVASGSFSQSGRNYTLAGNIGATGGTTDNMLFARTPTSLSGNFDITYRLDSFSAPLSEFAKFAPSIRKTLDANSQGIWCPTFPSSPGHGVNCEARLTTGAAVTEPDADAGVTAPLHVRLNRTGNTYTYYTSGNGNSWTQRRQVTVAMSDPVYAGVILGETSGQLVSATATNFSINNLSEFTYSDTGRAANTTYTYTARAVDLANNESALTSNLPATTQVAAAAWAANTFYATTGVAPILPWVAGRGADSYGGSGRDSVTGGVAASSTVHWITSNAQMQACLNATGRRYCIITRSGVYDFGANSELETRNAGTVTFIDLSPAPGAAIIAGSLPVWNVPNVAFINLQLFSRVTTPEMAAGLGTLITGVGTGSLSKFWLGYSSAAWSPDQIVTFYLATQDSGTFANIFYQGLYNSPHPESPHSTGMILGWAGAVQRHSSLRDIFAHNMWRNPLTAANDFEIADGLIYNWGGQAISFQQNGSGIAFRANVEHMLGIVGPNLEGGRRLVEIASSISASSQIYLTGNRVIGQTDSNGASDVTDNGKAGFSLSGSRVTQAVAPGYTVNPIGISLAEKIARADILVKTSGPRPGGRLPVTQAILDNIMARANSTGSNYGSRINDGQQVYPSGLAQNTANFFAADPPPGVANQNAGGVSINSTGQTVGGDATCPNHTAFECWMFRRLADPHIGIKP